MVTSLCSARRPTCQFLLCLTEAFGHTMLDVHNVSNSARTMSAGSVHNIASRAIVFRHLCTPRVLHAPKAARTRFTWYFSSFLQAAPITCHCPPLHAVRQRANIRTAFLHHLIISEMTGFVVLRHSVRYKSVNTLLNS